MKKRITKITAVFLLIVCTIFLASCKLDLNEHRTMEHGVDITIPADWKAHFMYPESVPSLHFGYDGINVLASSTDDHYTFVKNDFRKISDAWEAFLIPFKDDYIITRATKQMNETVSARLGSEYLPLDEMIKDPNNPNKMIKQESSMEYLMVCFGTDGTRYSCSFRTYVSEGKRYYGYAYTGNLEIKLNMPIMVIKDPQTNEKKFLLLPLPFDTKYTVSNNARLDAVLKRDSYLEESNYLFDYPETYHKDHYVIGRSDKETKEEKQKYTLEEKVTFIEAWYKKYCAYEEIDGKLYVEYAGARFMVNFDAGSEREAFSLEYKGPAQIK